jgi:hypothetical protein
MRGEHIGAALLVLVGLINLAPGLVAVAPGRVAAVYGTGAASTDRDLELLLRHRAVLLATVGTGLIVAAFAPTVRGHVISVAVVSMTTFVMLVLALGPAALNDRTKRVAMVDVLALLLLVPAIFVLL